MAILGRDLSDFDGDSPDLSGLGFVICKAGQGVNDTGTDFRYHQRTFAQHIAQAKAKGITPGAYHFLEHGNGAGQARVFANAVRAQGGPEGWLLAVDVERYDPGEVSQPDPQDLADFHTELHKQFPGHPLLVYSYQSFWVSDFHNDNLGCPLCKLWSASYGGTPLPYGGFSEVTLHQYSATPYDQDRFNGTPTELAALTIQGDDLSAQDVQAINDHTDKGLGLLLYGDGPNSTHNTHPANLANIYRLLGSLIGQVAGLTAVVKAGNGNIDLAAVQAAAEQGVKQAFIDLGQAAGQ